MSILISRFAFLSSFAFWAWFIRIKAAIVINGIAIFALKIKRTQLNLTTLQLITYSIDVIDVEWEKGF